jgi:hypothetical protein
MADACTTPFRVRARAIRSTTDDVARWAIRISAQIPGESRPIGLDILRIAMDRGSRRMHHVVTIPAHRAESLGDRSDAERPDEAPRVVNTLLPERPRRVTATATC